MDSKLVFIHIPKCAGSSLSHALVSHFGRDKSFLIGQDFPRNPIFFPRRGTADKAFISGHRAVDFYHQTQGFLFVAIVREPISRALSLYNYYTQPHNAVDDHARNERHALLHKWRKKGMDANSLLRSIENSRQFRYEISNAQCRYLSEDNQNRWLATYRHYVAKKSSADFESALATINSHKFVIGIQKNIHLLAERLSEILAIPVIKIGHQNSSKESYQDYFAQDKQSIELIKSLNASDEKLYHHIERQTGSVLDTSDQ